MKPEEYTECSNCNMEGPVRSMQDELPLGKPLCRKCRNAIPATVEDLINRYDAYVTDLEQSRSLCLAMAEGFAQAIDIETPALALQRKLTKSLHRP